MCNQYLGWVVVNFRGHNFSDFRFSVFLKLGDSARFLSCISSSDISTRQQKSDYILCLNYISNDFISSIFPYVIATKQRKDKQTNSVLRKYLGFF